MTSDSYLPTSNNIHNPAHEPHHIPPAFFQENTMRSGLEDEDGGGGPVAQSPLRPTPCRRWLTATFEMSPGWSIPRSTLYHLYTQVGWV